MATTLIVGNGFDLNLGLQTSYADYLNSENFRNLLVDNNLLARHLENKHNSSNWVDIEAELSNYSREILTVSPDPRQASFEKDYYFLLESLASYLDALKLDCLNKNSLAYRLLYKLVKENEDELTIFNFNYTGTVQFILDELPNSGKKITMVHVHGSTKSGIVFGIEDNSSIHGDHVFLQKAYKTESSKIISLNNSLRDSINTYIFGHSLGITDKMYFHNHFILVSGGNHRDKNIHLFYYGDSSKRDIYNRLNDLTNSQITLFKMNVNFTETDTSKNVT